jgi:hypothetical protein
MNFVQFLAEALKSRISRDMGPARFPGAGWDQIPLGTYYFSSDAQTSLIVIHRVVGEVLQHSLAAFGMMILQDAWRRFFEGISGTTTPVVALDRMRDAAATAIPLPHTMALGPVAPPAEAATAATVAEVDTGDEGARDKPQGKNAGKKRKKPAKRKRDRN